MGRAGVAREYGGGAGSPIPPQECILVLVCVLLRCCAGEIVGRSICRGQQGEGCGMRCDKHQQRGDAAGTSG